MKRVYLFLILLSVCSSTFSLQAQEPEFLRFPLAGHPVWVADLHPSDKLYPFLSQLQSLKLILLEPGIKKSKTVMGKTVQWYSARCFIIQGRTENFRQRGIIEISAGRLR